MKPVWLMLLTVCGLSTAANATPDPGAWRREVLLGSNRDSYFVWISTWAQPGSDHSYSASMAVECCSLRDHRAIESHDLVRYSANEFDPAGSWRHTPASLAPFDVASYLRDQAASPSFSEDYAVDVHRGLATAPCRLHGAWGTYPGDLGATDESARTESV